LARKLKEYTQTHTHENLPNSTHSANSANSANNFSVKARETDQFAGLLCLLFVVPLATHKINLDAVKKGLRIFLPP
jgi:hypothetical protein